MHIRIVGPPPASPPRVPQTPNGVRRTCSTHRSAPQTVAVSCQVASNTPVLELPVSPPRHDHRAAPAATGLNPHSARSTTCDHLPRLRALALLGRRHTRVRIDRYSGVRETCTEADFGLALKFTLCDPRRMALLSHTVLPVFGDGGSHGTKAQRSIFYNADLSRNAGQGRASHWRHQRHRSCHC